MARVAWENLSNWKKVASNIGTIRRWRGKTDVQTSEMLGIDIKRYRKIERGETQSLTLKEIVEMKTFFNVHLEELIPLEV